MAELDLNYLTSLQHLLQHNMAWKYIISYLIAVVIILTWNDAFHMSTLVEFNKRFNSLVDELSVYFEPCGFPIEIVARFSEGPIGQAMRSVRSLVACKMIKSEAEISVQETVRSAQTSTNGTIGRQMVDAYRTGVNDVPRIRRYKYKRLERQ